MIQLDLNQIRAVLLDIEGTTAQIEYVFGVLFPFAQTEFQNFLQMHDHNPPVKADLQDLRQEYENESLSFLRIVFKHSSYCFNTLKLEIYRAF